MGQEDFFLREIEKIGVLLKAIISRLISGREDLSLSVERSFLEAKEALLSETGIDLDKLLLMDSEETLHYISTFKFLNVSNLELLADLLYKLRVGEEPDKTKEILTKALQMLEICCLIDKTYSFERESRIGEIKSLLDDDPRA